MSAWIVSKTHIDALVRVAANGPRGTNRHDWYPPAWRSQDVPRYDAREDADRIGRLLWAACYESVAYRYDDFTGQDLPGPNGLTIVDIETYTYDPHGHEPALTAVEALKAIDCLEYQSCEHPRWTNSQARAFLHLLRSAIIGALPGYDEAPWGIH